MSAIEILALMIGAHFLADYPLQGDFLARGKNRNTPFPGVHFLHPLIAHSSIHGTLVGIITGSLWLGLIETAIHAVTDDAKCRGRISYETDQAIHIACKVAWSTIFVRVIA
jgi:hypothetical protein